MPHDWINVHVDGDADARTVVKQCARCRLLAVVHESGTRAAIDYHPQHIRPPQDCPRGDMTEERASETAALRADLARVTAERDVWLRTAQELARDAEVLAESVRQFVVEDEFNPGRPEAKVKLRAMRGTLSEYRRKMSASYFDAIERGDHAKGGG